MNPAYAVQIIVSSLAFGGVYALVAVGIVFIWKTVNVLNFAHGHLLTFGVYLAVVWLHRGYQWPIWAGTLAALGILALVGIVFSRTVFERLRYQPMLSKVVSTMGLGLIIVNTIILIFGPSPRAFTGFLGRRMLWIGNIGILAEHFLSFGVTAFILLLMGIIFKYTMVGKVMRALAFSREVGGLMGIPVPRYLAGAFAVAVALAGVAGMLIVPVTFLDFTLGDAVGYKGFAALVVGGFGTIPGAIIGGYLVGLMEGLGTVLVGSHYRDAVAAALILLVLLLRPGGLLGVKEEERL